MGATDPVVQPEPLEEDADSVEAVYELKSL